MKLIVFVADRALKMDIMGTLRPTFNHLWRRLLVPQSKVPDEPIFLWLGRKKALTNQDYG